MEQLLRIDNIEKYYGSRSNLTKAVDNLSLSVDRGEFVAIMGASGSGKTGSSAVKSQRAETGAIVISNAPSLASPISIASRRSSAVSG